MLTYTMNEKSKIPLYEQLYRNIKTDIINGKIKSGEKLPSKRVLCTHLGISKVTVEHAYAQLADEGYIYSVEKSGYLSGAGTKQCENTGICVHDGRIYGKERYCRAV